MPEETPEDDETEEVQLERSVGRSHFRTTSPGEMNPRFRFPSPAPDPAPPGGVEERKSQPEEMDDTIDAHVQPASVITPSSIEVPPPPPVEKEQLTSVSADESEDDLGDTVDIPLN